MIGIDKAFITLHAGRDNKLELYNEPISISKESSEKISKAKSEGKHIVAVGSTAIRLLESTADYILKGEAYDGETSILIKPPFSFKVADILITNFHLPNSRLLLLVDAFLEDKKSKRKVKDLYEIAIKDKFRFHSFGDAMLIV
jgi:S-adenosylmethionine:tRNA ribosyltransferase-isomerase